MISPDVTAHCAEIERCNQRGGRMLSVADLLEAGTITRESAAYSLAAIGAGASFMTGALPGGAGKTTLMGALLNMVPNDVELATADNETAIKEGLRSAGRKRCYICHEIGEGPYYAYLWGEPLRKYFGLPEAGHMVATNLHSDDYEQARAQVCGNNGVPQDNFRRVNIIYFLAVERDRGHVRRQINAIWESDGVCEHRPVYSIGLREDPGAHSTLLSGADFQSAKSVIDRIADSGVRTVEEVRDAIVNMRNV